MAVLPFCLIFELVSAVVEVLAVVTFILGTCLGIINLPVALLFVAAGLGYGAFLTTVSVIIEEITYHRYRSWRDFALLLCGGITENIGYRQLYAWWRVRGLMDALTRRKATWLEKPTAGPPGEPMPPASGVGKIPVPAGH
jgi:hypothetical protein